MQMDTLKLQLDAADRQRKHDLEMERLQIDRLKLAAGVKDSEGRLRLDAARMLDGQMARSEARTEAVNTIDG